MKEYVLGFIFDKPMENVILILKNKPDWQKGLYNGIGGSVEDVETAFDAIFRECKEECGLEIPFENWYLFSNLTDEHCTFDVMCFYTTVENLDEAKTLTDEKIEIFPVNSLPENVIPNLRWMIPFCINEPGSAWARVTI